MSRYWDEAEFDAMISARDDDIESEEAYEEMREQVQDEFKSDLLRAYYLDNPQISQLPIAMLNEARAIIGMSASGALALACTSVECTLKNLILRPLVHGVIHQDSMADLVADLTLGHVAMERFRDLLFGVLNEFAAIDLTDYSRPGCADTLWTEIRRIQASRNATLHRCEPAVLDEAKRAVALAEHLLDSIFQQVIGKFGFVVDESGTIEFQGESGR